MKDVKETAEALVKAHFDRDVYAGMRGPFAVGFVSDKSCTVEYLSELAAELNNMGMISKYEFRTSADGIRYVVVHMRTSAGAAKQAKELMVQAYGENWKEHL